MIIHYVYVPDRGTGEPLRFELSDKGGLEVDANGALVIYDDNIVHAVFAHGYWKRVIIDPEEVA